MKSPAYNEKDPSAKKKIRNSYSLIKRSVQLVLMHCPSFPDLFVPPSQLQKDIYAMARAAEETIRVALRFDEKSPITRRKLERQSGLKELEQQLRLPTNTPDDWRKYFNQE